MKGPAIGHISSMFNAGVWSNHNVTIATSGVDKQHGQNLLVSEICPCTDVWKMSHVHSVANSSDSGSSLSSDDEPKRRPSKDKRIVKTGSASHLDSNGESDEEVDRLHRILKEKSHELDEEKQTAKKVNDLTLKLFVPWIFKIKTKIDHIACS